ncbi:MAG: hypothetical protein ACFFD3_03305 [Candidatus Thorarchaeota archaeon]
MSRKKWGKSATKTEKLIRDAAPKKETLNEIDQYLAKAKSVTPYDIANRFSVRMSVARRILREKESEGVVVPYIKESGFVVYSTPAEMAKREGGAPIMAADVFEEIAASVPKESIIDEEMEAALAAASAAGTAIKPSKLAYKRRELGERKERKDKLPEVVVEPLPVESTPKSPLPERTEEEIPRKEEKPKKTTKKVTEEKPKKTTKKAVEEKPKKSTKKAEEETPKKTIKKAVEEKPKKSTKKAAEEEKPKKSTKKAAEEKPKKSTKKAAEEKPKKTTKKAAEETPKKETKKTTKGEK